uniref:HMG box domain-containing protein n=1 Tax=Strigamia maritima TaxID=126957 RepID=T1IXH4_STRMM
MPNKKKQYNGFYFFMRDMQEDLKKKGTSVKMEKMSELAHPKWTKLSQTEQDVYTARAKKYKEDFSDEGKMDCFGCSIKLAQNKQHEKKQKENDMIKNINRSLDKLSKNDIIKQKFHLIYFNYACKSDTNVFIPCEVGLVEYTIEKGIVKHYHTFIKPTNIPKGFKFTCINETKITHGIPHEDFELANADYTEIYNAIKRFVKQDGRSNSWKYVYAMPEKIEQIEKCLEWIHEMSGDPDDMCFEVYDILTLFVALRKNTRSPIVESIARDFLSKTTYDYESNIGCKFHDENDKSSNCALSIPKRLAFLLSDYLCDEYGVEIIQGQHFPDANDEQFVTVKSSSFKLSSATSKYEPEPPEPPKPPQFAKPIITKIGRSSVFQPDSVEIFGESYSDRAKKLADAASGSSAKQQVRHEPPTRYNEAVGWAPKSSQTEFQINKDDFPEIGSARVPGGSGMGRGVLRRPNSSTSDKPIAGIGRAKRKLPKRKQYNAFGSYMKDLRKEMTKTRKFVSQKEFIKDAHSKWKTLSSKEQGAYKVKAQKEKVEAREKEVAVTLPVINLNEIKGQKLQEVRKLFGAINPKKVVDEKFYLIFFNITCKVEPDMIHIPVEVGMIEYSIKKGITSEYQMFIDPGKIPSGYRFNCIEKSELSHGIPIENFKKASNDYEEILNDLNLFTKNCNVVYTLPDDLLVLDYTEQTVSCLNWLKKSAGLEDENNFQVYNVLDLLKCILEIANDKEVDETVRSYFSSTTYDYQPKMGCKFHDSADKNRYCALALARKCGYILSDKLGDLYNIESIPGKHFPFVEDNSVVIKSGNFKIPENHSFDRKKPAEKKEKGLNMIKTTGKSSVFQPDSVDIYGKKM